MSEETIVQADTQVQTDVQADTQVQADVQADTQVQTQVEPAQPINYEFNLPDDYQFSEGERESIIEFARENNLSVEAAQELVDYNVSVSEFTINAMNEQFEQEREAQALEWQNEIINDPVLGGDNLERTISAANRAVDSLGREIRAVENGKPVIENGREVYTNDFRDMLESSGLANHPVMIRALSQLGGFMAEGRIVHGNMGGSEKPLAQQMYSKSNMNP